jgi:hypothetical protein
MIVALFTLLVFEGTNCYNGPDTTPNFSNPFTALPIQSLTSTPVAGWGESKVVSLGNCFPTPRNQTI